MHVGRRAYKLYEVIIAIKLVTALRKLAAQCLDELLSPVGETIAFALKRYNVIACRVEPHQTYVLVNAKIFEHRVQRLAGVGAAYIVHTCVKDSISSAEALEASADLAALLKDRNLISVPGEDTARRESAETTSYYDTLLHFQFV